MMALELTEWEEQIILKLRKEAEQEQRQREMSTKLLRVSSEFDNWLRENGAGATYSTFCDDFGYEAVKGEDRPCVYKFVMELIELSRNLSKSY